MVTDAERPKYAEAEKTVSDIAEIPDSIHGMPGVRNWVLDHFKEEALFVLDDDLEAIHVRSHERARFIYDPVEVEQIIDNTYICALDAGAKVFGFSIARNPVSYKANLPFKLGSWVDQGWGIIGRDIRFDVKLRVNKEDVDYCLASLRDHRFIWSDSRYAWVGQKRGNRGGLTKTRTSTTEDQDLRYLQSKWQRHLRVTKKKGVLGISLRVDRKQPLIPSGTVH